MGGFLGAIAGLGMLLLIGVLFFAFLYQAGAVHQKQVKHWGFAAGIALGMGMAYWLLGGLFYGVLFEELCRTSE